MLPCPFKSENSTELARIFVEWKYSGIKYNYFPSVYLFKKSKKLINCIFARIDCPLHKPLPICQVLPGKVNGPKGLA